MNVQNAKELPKRYYGLHFYPGVAEYQPPDEKSYRIFINESTIRKMEPTFEGKPIFVRHVDEVNLKSLESDMDGVVVRSFFNKADGKHWSEFMITTDKGHAAIRNRWKLSNAYIPTSWAPGGVHNGVQYDKEVMDGEYEHLALVDDPRYEQSMILTPEEFKAYNAKHELELHRLTNSQGKSKGEPKMGLQFWKRAKVENAGDLESTVVQLPKSKKEMTITELVNAMDAVQNMQGYANGDHHVKVGEEEMTVNELVSKHMEMVKKHEADGEEKHENEASDEEEKKKEKKEENDADEKKEPELANAGKEAGSDEKKEPELANKKKNSAGKEKESKGHFDRINNATDVGAAEDNVVDLVHNQLTRGKQRYGS